MSDYTAVLVLFLVLCAASLWALLCALVPAMLSPRFLLTVALIAGTALIPPRRRTRAPRPRPRIRKVP